VFDLCGGVVMDSLLSQTPPLDGVSVAGEGGWGLENDLKKKKKKRTRLVKLISCNRPSVV